ncbi:serine/Arginine-related protein 53 isoform X1 [Lates calcarifer]|uniref:Serine/Arginine-related protein 53 isoform X1 n=1 Tax=Lates calcarifer TaxID=8187 RepID=A0AAJ7Q8A9_LATCA|nr:serine/Arginine-related protein 53 isoform X1 [Lates calcarifer]XP_018549492.1 serine/Arginine-related protein 53 isoform X1 [Lates calcarifer]XP_018549493.1 serine/Arginine-related protein 53 isoform X1 [Lates calcarifer]
MGRRSSDSDDDGRSRRKRKQRRRSSSSSSSLSSSSGSRVTSSRSRRSSRRSRSRSRDRDRDKRRRRHSSSSSSRSSSRKRRSRSAVRDKGRSHRSYRSRSRDRRSHSRHRRSRSRSGSRSRRGSHSRKRSRSHSRRRSRSRSRERDRSRRKGRDRDREKERDRGRDREKDKSKDKGDKKGDTGNIKGGLEHLTPAEQAKVRMHMVLQAAAKTDEVLRAKVAKREEEARKKLEEVQFPGMRWSSRLFGPGESYKGTSLEEQVRRIKDIEAIESDSFVPQAFKSSRDDIKTEPAEVKQESERADSQEVTLPMSIVYYDSDTLAHPSLFMDKEKAEELWLNRLISLRQERLMGSPVP